MTLKRGGMDDGKPPATRRYEPIFPPVTHNTKIDVT